MRPPFKCLQACLAASHSHVHDCCISAHLLQLTGGTGYNGRHGVFAQAPVSAASLDSSTGAALLLPNATVACAQSTWSCGEFDTACIASQEACPSLNSADMLQGGCPQGGMGFELGAPACPHHALRHCVHIGCFGCCTHWLVEQLWPCTAAAQVCTESSSRAWVRGTASLRATTTLLLHRRLHICPAGEPAGLRCLGGVPA